MPVKTLITLPVYNEQATIAGVLERTLAAGHDVLVVDDGSTDGTAAELARFPSVMVVRHAPNRGYGGALTTAFAEGIRRGYDLVITLDSDGQHDPSLIPQFIERARSADIVSGSRYLREFAENTAAPLERRRINMLLSDLLNARLGLDLTDAFCGFKAYRTDALRRIELTEAGYAMPLELWVQAACRKLRIAELAVPRVYLDPNRTFGGTLDDADRRLAYYTQVIDSAMDRARARSSCGIRGRQPVESR
jgi:dolichol-phosphate mannosyltransferase